jgi:anti-sigma factor RsiW
MSHVDEGTLHALVDDALAPTERASVEAHLAVCGDCARHFADAMAMARQVHTLLDALDDVRAPLRVEPSVPASTARPAGSATPMLHRMRTLRRLALAASVLVVAGISYRFGVNRTISPASEGAAPGTAAVEMASPAAMPIVMDTAPEAIALPSAPTVRMAPRGGLRGEQEVAASGGVAARSGAVIPAPPLAAVPQSVPQVQRVVMPESRVTAADEAGERAALEASQRATPRRAMAEASSMARRAAPAPTPTDEMSSPPAEQHVGGAAANSVVRPASRALAGYQAVEEVTMPLVTRRRYVAVNGTTLLLVIAPAKADEAKPASAAAKAAPEFLVSTAKGRSTVRWQSGGLSYELQGALTPDSLVKLATLLK